ncbi:Chanoclavine-I aldehyde reductase easA [Lachnellula suecica]|uniref:Chanoclavine-I aldehyde reductase easA n=1 Tax=Lachnellula suecica TaxID=602035 RepID=A0A8T9BYD1_9HELO|nr:Chanoclavine-I aldehyde reductase easA [Lachnellula suecica]
MESKLFQSLQVGKIKLDHRIIMAPLTRLRADNEHVQLPIAVEYYSQRASVPGTLIITEATVISPAHSGFPHAPGLWTDAQIAAWKNITNAVHARKCSIFCQLVAPGRAAVVDSRPLLSSSATGMTADSAIPHEMTPDQILSCISDFKQAAKNAMLAGFDGVEVHGANGYLVDQFIQDNCNKRSDSWGGGVANRARLALEIVAALVDAVGADRVGFRISPFSLFQGMKMADPIPQFSYLVERLKQHRLAYLHVIESRVNNNIDVEKTDSINFILDIWGTTSPLFVAGGYTPENAVLAVDDEYKNYNVAVVFGRHFLANPDLPYRIKHGLPLNKYHRASFYTPLLPVGYIDYPFSSGFIDGRAL